MGPGSDSTNVKEHMNNHGQSVAFPSSDTQQRHVGVGLGIAAGALAAGLIAAVGFLYTQKGKNVWKRMASVMAPVDEDACCAKDEYQAEVVASRRMVAQHMDSVGSNPSIIC